MSVFLVLLQSNSSNKVQFNENKESVTSQNTLTPQYSTDSTEKPGIFIGGRHQRRLSRTAIDRLGLMRQSTVPPATDASFAIHSVDSDIVSEPSLTRGASVAHSVDEPGLLNMCRKIISLQIVLFCSKVSLKDYLISATICFRNIFFLHKHNIFFLFFAGILVNFPPFINY